MLCDMRPPNAPDNQTNRHLAYTKPLGDRCLAYSSSSVQGADHTDVVRSQLRLWVQLSGTSRSGHTTPCDAAALCCHVRHVVGGRADPQMGRSNTGWVVANVHNKAAVRDRTNIEAIGISVRQDRLLMLVVKKSIPRRSSVAGPGPAIIGLLNPFPKALCCGHRTIARSTAVNSAISEMRPDLESFTTASARLGYRHRDNLRPSGHKVYAQRAAVEY